MRRVLGAVALALITGSVAAEDFVKVPRMTTGLARDIAQAAVDACNNAGYQVTAVVVDRNAIPQVMMRDIFASRFTIQIATEKANAVILSGTGSGEFRRNRGDIRPELNHVDGILMMEGGLPIRAAGSLVGAVGVSGAPGGDKDAICAAAALKKVQERLDFID